MLRVSEILSPNWFMLTTSYRNLKRPPGVVIVCSWLHTPALTHLRTVAREQSR
jgi:hypothetical protein